MKVKVEFEIGKRIELFQFCVGFEENSLSFLGTHGFKTLLLFTTQVSKLSQAAKEIYRLLIPTLVAVN